MFSSPGRIYPNGTIPAHDRAGGGSRLHQRSGAPACRLQKDTERMRNRRRDSLCNVTGDMAETIAKRGSDSRKAHPSKNRDKSYTEPLLVLALDYRENLDVENYVPTLLAMVAALSGFVSLASSSSFNRPISQLDTTIKLHTSSSNRGIVARRYSGTCYIEQHR